MAVKRDQIVAALATRMGTIATPTYNTNAGANVDVWRVTPYNENELPAINIMDVRDELEGEQIPASQDWMLGVRIHCIANLNQVPDGILRSMIADVYKAIGVDDTFGNLAIQTNLENDDSEIEQKEKRTGVGTVNVSIQYRENKLA